MDDLSLLDPSQLNVNNMDPNTVGAILQALPQLQQQQRRVAQLKQQQDAMQALQNQPGTGNMMPTQQGGLYPTVAQWQPDYAKAGNQMMGAIGQAITQNQGNAAQDDLNQNRNAAVLKAVQGSSAGQDPRTSGVDPNLLNQTPTSATVRAYLALMGGPDLKDVIGPIPHVSSKYVGNDGFVYKVMSNGDEIKSQEKSSQPVGSRMDAEGNLVSTPKTTAELNGAYNTGNAAPTTSPVATVANTTAAPTSGAGPATDADSIISNVMGREGGYVANDAGKGPTNFGVNSTAHPEVGDVSKLTADTAKPIYAATYQQIGGDSIPAAIREAALDTAINQGPDVAKQLIAQSGGDPAKYAELRGQVYNQTFLNPANAGRFTQGMYSQWMQRNHDTTQPIGGQAPAATTAPNAPTPGAIAQPGQKVGRSMQDDINVAGGKAGAAAQARMQVQLDNAGAMAANAASKAGTVIDATEQRKAAATLPVLRDNTKIFTDQINRLLSDPALAKIAGGQSQISKLADDRVDSEAGTYLKANTDAAHLMALYHQIKSSAAVQGLAQFRGTGARITNNEFNTDAKAVAALDRSQDLPSFVAELSRIRDHANMKLDDISDFANGPVQRTKVAGMTGGGGAAQAPAPAQGTIDVSGLLQQYNEGQ